MRKLVFVLILSRFIGVCQSCMTSVSFVPIEGTEFLTFKERTQGMDLFGIVDSSYSQIDEPKYYKVL